MKSFEFQYTMNVVNEENGGSEVLRESQMKTVSGLEFIFDILTNYVSYYKFIDLNLYPIKYLNKLVYIYIFRYVIQIRHKYLTSRKILS